MISNRIITCIYKLKQLRSWLPCTTISGVSGEDIDEEAVLVAHHGARIVRRPVDAFVAVPAAVADALPSGGRDGGLEAEFADRRLRVGNPVEGDVKVAIAGGLLFAGYFT